MRRFIILFLITGTVWAQTDFDKLVLDDGTETLGKCSGVEENIIYFKPIKGLTYQVVSISRIQSLQLRDGKTVIKDGYIKMPYALRAVLLDQEDLYIKDKAIYDAKKDARNWILYTPAAFSIFVSSIYGK